MGSAPLDPIPTLDISSFVFETDAKSRQYAAREFARKCARNGCLAIVGHGVSSELLGQAFAVSTQLFDLPYEEKMKAPHPDALIPHRGYSYVGREKGATKKVSDNHSHSSKNAPVRPTEYKVRLPIDTIPNAERSSW